MLDLKQQNPTDECRVVVFGMKFWTGNVKRTFSRIIVPQVIIKWKQVHVVHAYIVVLVLHLQEASIYQGGPIEPKPIVLVEDKDMKRDLLFVQEGRNVRNELKQLVETIPEGNQNGQLWLIARDVAEAAVKLFVLDVPVLTLASV